MNCLFLNNLFETVNLYLFHQRLLIKENIGHRAAWEESASRNISRNPNQQNIDKKVHRSLPGNHVGVV